MQGKTVVITGSTSGIGEVAAQRLAAAGARIVLVARDKARAEATLAKLRGTAPGVAHSVHYGDLSRISEMKRLAAGIALAEPKIDVLVNNAGALFNTRKLTEDGLEYTFATNHVAYHVLTLGLLESLRAAGAARVVSTASDAHKGASLDFDDLQSAKGFSGFKVYGKSKLCNILWTRELARRWADTGVTVNCLHPGFVATRFGSESGGFLQPLVGIAKNFAISPEKGAETIVYLASSPDVEGVSGGYFYKCRPAMPTRTAQDDLSAKRLWDETAKLTGVGG
ncbi:MAG: SDR family NAD(P)-dependent oxidoreductase [Parvibaculum sp.]|uniref:SDR family NAD(P)-dependent oxidoreductase n=1 Tax=Parvibaculum sp. TaxID=2024848 RepID=UPI0025F5EC68|nr:SDR family NAD(P)-dependent oxidoreductase [Parvibaculum sp.]MCE9650785.1 SDR family NAD(P)-dependent oxidoreductase [Parvibaculum sp.]